MFLARAVYCPQCYRYYWYEYGVWYSTRPRVQAVAWLLPATKLAARSCSRCDPRYSGALTAVEWYEYIPGDQASCS